MSKDAGMRGAPSMPAEIIVGNAIDLVIALRNVCTLADPELASECRRRLGSLGALAAKVEASGPKLLPAMMGIDVKPSDPHLSLSDVMRCPHEFSDVEGGEA